jgi:hypothetical protein
MAAGETRPGYELWRPNREKASSVTTKAVMVLLLLVTAGLCLLVTIGGWSLLQGGAGMGVVCLVFVLLFLVFAFRVALWSRGALPVAAALSMLVLIFAAVGADSWFQRNKSGFNTALLSDTVIGTILVLLIPLQIVVITVAMIAFNQEWQVEEERPTGSGGNYETEPPPPDPRATQPA